MLGRARVEDVFICGPHHCSPRMWNQHRLRLPLHIDITNHFLTTPPPSHLTPANSHRQVIPDLRKHLVVNSETVRAPVALAVVKVLRLLPEDAARAELPRVLQSVANLLSKPLQRIRDDARAVLVSMAVELGPAYLPFVIDVIMVSSARGGCLRGNRGDGNSRSGMRRRLLGYLE